MLLRKYTEEVNNMEIDVIKKAIAEYGTPSYVFDLDILKERVMGIKDALGNKACICYAMKANPFVIGPMNSYIDKYEVCSPGEYEICHRQGIAPEKIVVSGVNKTYESMTRIMSISGGKGVFTMESAMHYDILDKVCKEQGTNIKVLVRLTSGNQFGVDKTEFERLIKLIAENDNMELLGLHFYSGTQKKLKKVEKELTMLAEYRNYIQDTYGISLKELEYGPGLLVNYFESDKDVDAGEQLEELNNLLDVVSGYEDITLEMGRFIATECGYYLTSVVDIKNNEEHNYCIVDGGIHQLNYYGQIMGMKKPYMDIISDVEATEELLKWNMCGSLCTVNDVILKDIELQQLHLGDCIVFKKCGAYSVTEGMAMFLSRELPQILFYSKDDGLKTVRKRIGTDVFNTSQED